MPSAARHWGNRTYTIITREQDGRRQFMAAIVREGGKRPEDACGHPHDTLQAAIACRNRLMRRDEVPRAVIRGDWWRRSRR